MTVIHIPRRLLTEEPGWAQHADVVVVGSGIAGLTTALEARKAGRVLLVTKTSLSAGATAWAQGGIAAALGPEDSPEQHLHDTLVAGVGLCADDAVRTLVTEGPRRVRELAALGTEFELADDGSIALTREGGHRRDRIAHAGGDATGREISRALIEALRAVQEDPGIEVIENALVTDILTDATGRACGVALHVIGAGRIDGLGAALGRAVVLATGGIGQVYASTTNPPVSTGDGVAAALRAGAEIVDLEFVQFHPTVLWLGRTAKGQQPLISEAVRGEGAHLRDVEGRRFMRDQHELAELAPRHVVAKAVVTAMADTGAEHVWLDTRHLGAAFLEERFPTIVAKCRSYGIDPATDLVPVAPAQHYASGGVRTDGLGRTTVPGLYACGEVAWTGVHGANRLASNSLLEGLVWGHRIAVDLTENLAEVAVGDPQPRPGPAALLDPEAGRYVQAAMTAGAGVLRSASSLQTLQARLATLSQERRSTVPTPAAWETTNLHAVAVTLGRHAAIREETRGGHWREDFPDRDDTRWLGHLVSSLDPDGILETTFQPMREKS
ncbi:L-aspartate oxidase [Phytoactinopolyspora limicola]|uniref:L-aspartate oxidase n=1 Tax=Phytoactinopolyspora limicola TaxID=2715536 RepID=UPI00140C5CC5|nr:L-aspartate oxidase [Phytoactinopolyspora limicola]